MIKKKVEDKAKAISYRAKEKTTCPVCRQEFQIEMLHSGGGRLIAGKLTPELRRLYEVSKKYGKVYPLAYSIVVCPQCLYSSFPKEFEKLEGAPLEDLRKSVNDRRASIEKIAGQLDYSEDRNLVTGAASYLLAIECYQRRDISVAPTPKKAICSLRGAWLFSDMNDEFPGLGFDKVRDFLYTKAVTYYSPTLDIMTNGREPHDQFLALLGPDTDKNWGFDGVIYINGYLTRRFLDRLAPSPNQKIEMLDKCKRHLGKLYGMGRASSSKPSIIIDMAKELYEQISNQLEEMTAAAPV
ncbi:MAG: DUF2225 domain-containing protein [Leptospirales bacterium]|nr:DUF2225 domain-containing protein [Leptospirales bacterium]